MSKVMLIANLHEIDFLNEVLAALARVQVRDCVVQQVECVPSHHTGDGLEPNTLASVAGLFKPQHKVNYLINAIADEDDVKAISTSLKAIQLSDRFACSFWFIPVTGYWYHKSGS
jgi:hypothetical protein